MTLVLSLVFLGIMAALILGAVAMTFSRGVGGFANMNDNVPLTDNIGVQANPTLVAAQPATLSVVSGTTGTLTMTNASHGIVTGQRVDLYWVGGQCYGVTVGTVAGTTVPFTAVSGGSALPAQGTAVSVGVCVPNPFAVIGNNLTGLACYAPKSGYFVFNDGTADVYAAFVTGGRVFTWKTGDVPANPLAGHTPTQVFMSHSDQSGPNSGMMAAAISH